MISDLLSWYAQQMRGLVPARLAAADPADVNALLVTPRPGQEPPASLAISLRRNGQETLLGMHQAGDTTLQRLRAEHPAAVLLLRLPEDALLVRDVSLPIAAEADYERVLGYEMDRLTPFPAAELFWTAHVLRRNRAAGRLDLRLHLVPRAWVAAPLALMAEAGMRPAALEAQASQAGSPDLRIALAHDARQGRSERLKFRISAGACAALAAIAIVLPFILQSMQAAGVERRIAALQPQVNQVQALRHTLLAGSAGADAIAGARRRLGDPLQLMASLTRVLPDDTYLSDLALRAGTLTLTGQSASAVRLIPALSADPAFSAPAFSAPVTRIEASNTDLFSIRARVAAR